MNHQIVLPSHTRIVSEEDNKGVYEIDNLYPGYGQTLGNSIRRILLSSLLGAAITKVKIDGVNHEFSTLTGVEEDIVAIIMNLKQLRFQLHGDEPQVATIDMKGVREIKGKDIKCPTQLEVKTKDSHIATLTDKNAHFSAELTVERGIGFVMADQLTKDKVEVGTLLLDAIFTPIRRAKYDVENMRVGDRTDYNRLRISLETDGSIAPREAFKKALGIMRQQIESIEHFDEAGASADKALEVEKAPIEKGKISAGMDSLKLSQRVKNSLEQMGISSPEELASKTEDDLRSIEGVGDKAITEIKKALGKIDLSLGE